MSEKSAILIAFMYSVYVNDLHKTYIMETFLTTKMTSFLYVNFEFIYFMVISAT